MLIARERLGMDMPVHVLIRALCELLHRVEIIEVQESLIDAAEAPLGILPEGRQRETRDEVAPEQICAVHPRISPQDVLIPAFCLVVREVLRIRYAHDAEIDIAPAAGDTRQPMRLPDQRTVRPFVRKASTMLPSFEAATRSGMVLTSKNSAKRLRSAW